MAALIAIPCETNHHSSSPKATLNLPLATLARHVPEEMISAIRKHRYYRSKTDAIAVESATFGRGPKNKEDCIDKFYKFLWEVGNTTVSKESSQKPDQRYDEIVLPMRSCGPKLNLTVNLFI